MDGCGFLGRAFGRNRVPDKLLTLPVDGAAQLDNYRDERQVGLQEPGRNVFLCEAALLKHGRVTLSQRPLDCHPVLEPVAKYINEVSIFRKTGPPAFSCRDDSKSL